MTHPRYVVLRYDIQNGDYTVECMCVTPKDARDRASELAKLTLRRKFIVAELTEVFSSSAVVEAARIV